MTKIVQLGGTHDNPSRMRVSRSSDGDWRRSLEHLGRSSELRTLKNAEKVKWGPTDGRTDGQSRRTKVQTGKMTNTTKCEKNSQRENEDEKKKKIQ